MRIIVVDPSSPSPISISEAADVLRRGGLVAFPTETVYGLGANALDAKAVARIFAAKGRPSYNPLIVHLPDVESARELVREWSEQAEQLAREFWPGPLTLVLRRREIVPDIVTAGLDSVALRVPSHPVALALLRAARIPLAAPSANRSTELSPTTAEHVVRSLGDRVDLILDGGATDLGIESTVLDLRGPIPAVLRPGLIGVRELEPLVGQLAEPNETSGETPRPAPGMLERHYAPRARLILFDTAESPRVAREMERAVERGARAGALIVRALLPAASGAVQMPTDAPGYAQRLYATLHALDDDGCEVVFVERVPNDPAWAGVRDRLERASRDM